MTESIQEITKISKNPLHQHQVEVEEKRLINLGVKKDVNKEARTHVASMLKMVRLKRDIETQKRKKEEVQITTANQQKNLEQTQEKLRQAEDRARIDSLTGMPNRPAFKERLTYEIERAKRDKKPVALMTFDIDHFKNVNDELGHDAGDQVLKDVASYFLKEKNGNNGKPLKRAIDFVARYGGDEFQIISPEVLDEKGEEMLAEKIRMGLQNNLSRVHLKDNVKPTISIGITFYNPFEKEETTDEAIKRVIKEADTAMYKAKELGKNMVIVYSPDV